MPVSTPSPRPAPLPFRVVWAGPLGGDRPARVAVHAGGVDAALAAVAPRLVASVPGLGDVAVAPTALADLRPRQIARALPALRALADLARREADGDGADTFAASGAPEAWVRRAVGARQRAEADAGSTAVDRLLRLTGQAAPASFRDEVGAEVDRVEAALAADADLARLRRAWRSLAWLARRLDLRGSVRLDAVAGDLDALLSDGGPLRDAVAGASLLAVDVEVGPSARDAERAGRLAVLGAEAGVPVVASAAPPLVGAADAAAPVPPLRWGADARFAAWEGVRRRPEARWLALAYPPVRLAPGGDLWGGGALAVAADVAAAHARGDGPAALGRAPVRDAGDLAVDLPADVAGDLGRHGVAVLGRAGDGARVVRAPSVAATDGPPARDAALSLPAALFAARVAAAVGGAAKGGAADGLRPALDREVGPWARVEDADGGLRVTLPQSASPTLAADVSLLLAVDGP